MKEIDPDLHAMQAEVGGDIGAAYPFRDPVAQVCNDKGKLIGLDLNRGLRDENGEIYDIMAGTFLVVGLGEEDFASLSPELVQKYTEHFRQPEHSSSTWRADHSSPCGAGKGQSPAHSGNDLGG